MIKAKIEKKTIFLVGLWLRAKNREKKPFLVGLYLE